VTPAKKKAVRARWTPELVLRINAPMMRSTPAEPVWPREELLAVVGALREGDRELVDLRGFPFYGLCNVSWSLVDLSASEHRKGRLAPGLTGTGAIGSSASVFASCRFDGSDAGDSNFRGRFTECSFVSARLDRMDFWNGTRLERCTFQGASLRRAKIRGDIHFIDCDFTRARLTGADLGQATFERCRFDGANLDEAAVMGVRFVACSMESISARSVIVEDNVVEGMPPPPFDARPRRPVV
jgi:uncharacterized protein YjbI with pentapeptide repeats